MNNPLDQLNCNACSERQAQYGIEPLCYRQVCPYNDYMIGDEDAYIELWNVLRAPTLRDSGLGQLLASKLDLDIDELEVLVHLDLADARLQKARTPGLGHKYKTGAPLPTAKTRKVGL